MAEVFISPAPSKRKEWVLRLTYSWWYPKIKDRMRYLCGAPPKHADTYTIDCSSGATTITVAEPPPPGAVIVITRVEGL